MHFSFNIFYDILYLHSWSGFYTPYLDFHKNFGCSTFGKFAKYTIALNQTTCLSKFDFNLLIFFVLLQGSIQVDNSALLCIWFTITSAFLVIEIVIISMLSDFLYNIVGVVIAIVPICHFLSFLTLLYYIIRVERYYIVEQDSKTRKNYNRNCVSLIVVPPPKF